MVRAKGYNTFNQLALQGTLDNEVASVFFLDLFERTNDAAAYLVDVLKEGDMEIYQINAASDDDVSSFYDALFFQGVSPSNTEKETFNNPNARVIDTYSLLTNNCVTTSVKGINSRSKIIKTNSISPDGLSDDLNESLGSSPKIVKIENPISFVFDLIKKLCHE